MNSLPAYLFFNYKINALLIRMEDEMEWMFEGERKRWMEQVWLMLFVHFHLLYLWLLTSAKQKNATNFPGDVGKYNADIHFNCHCSPSIRKKKQLNQPKLKSLLHNFSIFFSKNAYSFHFLFSNKFLFKLFSFLPFASRASSYLSPTSSFISN